jgi:hypothetical protein
MENTLEKSPGVELSIVLPVLGKGICLEGMLKMLTIEIAVPYEVLLICHRQELDPASLQRMCQEYPVIRCLEAQEKKQKPSTLVALQQGVRAASGQYVLIVCADTIGPIVAVNQMLELARDGYDFVSGTRYAGGGRRLGGSLIAITLSKLANHLLYSLSGCAFSDCTTGLKLFRKSAFAKLSLESNSEGWVVAFEMALKAQAAQLKIAEVANIAIDHLYGGDSTFHLPQEFFAYLKWFFWALINLPKTPVAHTSVPIRRIQIADC